MAGAPAVVKGYKVVLLGDMGAGKSSIASRFIKDAFDPHSASTIGAAFMTKTMNDKGIKLEIWDTAGQERYHSLAPMYYRGAHAAIIVFDVTSQDSFDKAHSWVTELHNQGGPNMVICLAANKVDIVEKRVVAFEDADAFSKSQQLNLLVETSAKTGQGVTELFNTLADSIIADSSQAEPAPANVGIQLDQQPAPPKASCC